MITNFHQAKCSGLWVSCAQRNKRNSDENNTVIATADSNKQSGEQKSVQTSIFSEWSLWC